MKAEVVVVKIAEVSAAESEDVEAAEAVHVEVGAAEFEDVEAAEAEAEVVAAESGDVEAVDETESVEALALALAAEGLLLVAGAGEASEATHDPRGTLGHPGYPPLPPSFVWGLHSTPCPLPGGSSGDEVVLLNGGGRRL